MQNTKPTMETQNAEQVNISVIIIYYYYYYRIIRISIRSGTGSTQPREDNSVAT